MAPAVHISLKVRNPDQSIDFYLSTGDSCRLARDAATEEAAVPRPGGVEGGPDERRASLRMVRDAIPRRVLERLREEEP